MFFIHPEASIGVLEKVCLNFWSTYPLAFKKIAMVNILGKLQGKHSF